MIGGNRRDNGLYLEKFKTREEAKEYIEKLADRYRYAPNQKRISIRKLTRDAEKDGVSVSRSSLSRWFEEMGIKIRDIRLERGSRKIQKTYTITNEIDEVLDNYENKSYMVELGLRVVTRMPVEDMILFLPEEEGEDPINVIFKTTAKGRVKATATGKLKNTDKQHITKILELANQKGIQVVREYAETFGFRWYGGD